MIESVLGFLKMNDVEYLENRSLKQLSTVGIGGKALIVAYPNDVFQLTKVVDFLKYNKIKHKILGRISNVLPRDECYQGVVVKTDKMSSFKINGTSVIADAGIPLPFLALTTAKCGLSGMEELSGIPGSLGGAIFGNAGAFNREISDLITSVDCYDTLSQNIVTLSGAECCFSYRSSLFKEDNIVILSAGLCLSDSSVDCTMAEIEKYKLIRAKTQPVGVKSLGSTFKRLNDGTSAAYYIDKCGLKGFSLGDAEISQKHAGFIVNKGLASFNDYVGLMKIARQRVKDKFNLDLIEEIEILN